MFSESYKVSVYLVLALTISFLGLYLSTAINNSFLSNVFSVLVVMCFLMIILRLFFLVFRIIDLSYFLLRRKLNASMDERKEH